MTDEERLEFLSTELGIVTIFHVSVNCDFWATRLLRSYDSARTTAAWPLAWRPQNSALATAALLHSRHQP